MSYEKERIKLRWRKDLPYTLVSNTSLPQSFHICLKAKGVKKFVENCHDEDLMHIIIFSGNKPPEFEISKFIEKGDDK